MFHLKTTQNSLSNAQKNTDSTTHIHSYIPSNNCITHKTIQPQNTPEFHNHTTHRGNQKPHSKPAHTSHTTTTTLYKTHTQSSQSTQTQNIQHTPLTQKPSFHKTYTANDPRKQTRTTLFKHTEHSTPHTTLTIPPPHTRHSNIHSTEPHSFMPNIPLPTHKTSRLNTHPTPQNHEHLHHSLIIQHNTHQNLTRQVHTNTQNTPTLVSMQPQNK